MTIAPSAGPLFDHPGLDGLITEPDPRIALGKVDLAIARRAANPPSIPRPTVVVLSDGPGLARTADPPTAQAAAELLKHRGSTLARIYRYLLDRGRMGATDNEVQLALGLPANSQPTRRNQLVRMGLTEATDRRRPTVRGRQAVVWVALIPE